MREWFGIVRWHCDDVIEAARNNGAEMTEEQARQWWEDNESSFENMITQYGDEVLSEMDFDI